jgi:ABC-type glycerol-3-phosphate transport system substrate-binding protein
MQSSLPQKRAYLAIFHNFAGNRISLPPSNPRSGHSPLENRAPFDKPEHGNTPPLDESSQKGRTRTLVSRGIVRLLLLSGLLAGGGCSGEIELPTPATERRWEGVELILRCPDASWRTALEPLVQSWAFRMGATVHWRDEAMRPGDDTDIAVLPAAELGSWADQGELSRVPVAFRQSGHPFQWTNVLLPYREYLIEWGGQAQALPLAGDAFLIVLRRDQLENATVRATHERLWKRTPTPPATWEEFAELAITLTQVSGQPCLPPWQGPELVDIFFRVAACYDRPALTDTDKVQSTPFFFDPQTAAPRLQAPAFGQAARWLASLVEHRCLPPSAAAPMAPPGAPPSAGQALARGQALLAVVSLRDLEALSRSAHRVDPRFLLAPLPGSRGYYTRSGSWVPTVTPNYVPYFAGGYLGVVRQRCRNPEAAFELLGELGGPARSLEILSTPGLNAGPFRSTHLDRDRLPIWYGYRLDAERSLHLQDALRSYVRAEVKNPVVGLRTPDQARLRTAAATELSRLLLGAPPEEVIQQLSAAWQRLDAEIPLADRLRWRQSSAGLAD